MWDRVYIDDDNSFKLVNQLITNAYASKIRDELSCKSKQTEIVSFFNWL